MSTFALHFNTDDAAFGESEIEMREEIARILVATAKNVRLGLGGKEVVKLHDINGNTIGEFKMLGRHGIGGSDV